MQANLIFCWTIAYAPTYLVTLVGRLFTGVMASGYYKSLIVLSEDHPLIIIRKQFFFSLARHSDGCISQPKLVNVLLHLLYRLACRGLQGTPIVKYTVGEARRLFIPPQSANPM